MTISKEEKNNYNFSKILINLMKGIVYREDDVNIWNFLEDNESQVSEHFKIIGLRLIVDKSRGYAYLKQIIFNQEEEQLPRLIRKQPLSRQVSILIVVLRQIVIEKENSGSDDRIIVSFDDIADKYRAFYPNSNDDEINSLEGRINNIPLEQINIRNLICNKTGLLDGDLPFVGELIQVKESEKVWQGAIERVLHGFGLSLLVSDSVYSKVSKAVDETNLKGKIVYFRVKKQEKIINNHNISPNSMVRKIKVKPDCWTYDWLQNELEERFNYICCENIELFQKEKYAVTINGQVKHGGVKHEKDDRKAINDASTFILGWNNKEKISNLKDESNKIQKRINSLVSEIKILDNDLKSLELKDNKLHEHIKYNSYEDIDCKSLDSEIKALKERLDELNKSSDKLNKLREQKANLEEKLIEIRNKISVKTKKQGGIETKINELMYILIKSSNEINTNSDFPKTEYLESCLNEIKKL